MKSPRAISEAFTPSTLSAGEAASIGGRCAAILGNGSGFGICNSCRAGALGGGYGRAEKAEDGGEKAHCSCSG
jgi:hypothetical protein